MFKENVGMIDRIIRIVVGVALLALFFLYPEEPWRWWTLIGLVPLLTGLFSRCLIYRLFGWSTHAEN